MHQYNQCYSNCCRFYIALHYVSKRENFKSLVEFLVINLSSCTHIVGCVRGETEQHHTTEPIISTAGKI